MFAGFLRVDKAMAIAFTLIETAKMNSVNRGRPHHRNTHSSTAGHQKYTFSNNHMRPGTPTKANNGSRFSQTMNADNVPVIMAGTPSFQVSKTR
jgi:hypothetical protein